MKMFDMYIPESRSKYFRFITFFCMVSLSLFEYGCGRLWDSLVYNNNVFYEVPALIQYIAPGYHVPTTVTASLPQAELKGDLLVATVYWDYYPTVTVTDSIHNNWIPISAAYTYCATPGPVHSLIQLWYAENILAGSNVITATQSGTPLGLANNGVGIYVAEYSGVAQSSALDSASGLAASSSSVTMSTGNITTTAPNDLIVASYDDNNGNGYMLGGSGYNRRATDFLWFSMTEDNIGFFVSPGSLVNPTGSLQNGGDNCWVGTAAAFKAATY